MGEQRALMRRADAEHGSGTQDRFVQPEGMACTSLPAFFWEISALPIRAAPGNSRCAALSIACRFATRRNALDESIVWRKSERGCHSA